MNNVPRSLYLICVVLWLATLAGLPALHTVHAGGVWGGEGTVRVVAFLGAFAGTVALVAGLGIEVAGTPLGLIESGRNTFSLSRLQMSMWTVLILSALMAVAVCRGWGLMGKASWSTALNIDIPDELFEVMGISFFSAAAVPSILALKSQPSSTPTQAQLDASRARAGEATLGAIGSVIQRPLSENPRLSDLVRGDDVATAGTIDVSKVQQLLITALLIAVYFAMLVNLFHTGSAADAVVAGTTNMPPFTPKFVNLLALSHAGYLVYKAAPRTAPDPATPSSPSATPRPSPPDRDALSN
ncbi:hypothetical protein [Cupriavidus basilensis]